MQTFVTDFGVVTCIYEDSGTTLIGTTSSTWWYGCSATCAGMLVAYYDTNGYNGYSYANLIPGGTAGSTVSGSWVANSSSSLFRTIVASEEHQRDYYSAETYGYNTGGGTTALGYGTSGDDSTTTSHTNNSLADYMGTSQDAYGCSNGSTRFWFYSNGSKLYTTALLSSSTTKYNSGNLAVGIVAYIESCGYSVLDSYTQLTDIYLASESLSGGFTFADFVVEILAGRPVLLSCLGTYNGSSVGHTMIGIGYEIVDGEDYITFYDTWDCSVHTMLWDSTYSTYEFSIMSVFVLELAAVPEPAAFAAIFGMLALAIAATRRKKV